MATKSAKEKTSFNPEPQRCLDHGSFQSGFCITCAGCCRQSAMVWTMSLRNAHTPIRPCVGAQKDHINRRISHYGTQAQYKGDTRNTVLQDPHVHVCFLGFNVRLDGFGCSPAPTKHPSTTTVDDTNLHHPISPNIHYTTLRPMVLVYFGI